LEALKRLERLDRSSLWRAGVGRAASMMKRGNPKRHDYGALLAGQKQREKRV